MEFWRMAVYSQLASKFHFDTPMLRLRTLSGALKWNLGAWRQIRSQHQNYLLTHPGGFSSVVAWQIRKVNDVHSRVLTLGPPLSVCFEYDEQDLRLVSAAYFLLIIPACCHSRFEG